MPTANKNSQPAAKRLPAGSNATRKLKARTPAKGKTVLKMKAKAKKK